MPSISSPAGICLVVFVLAALTLLGVVLLRRRAAEVPNSRGKAILAAGRITLGIVAGVLAPLCAYMLVGFTLFLTIPDFFFGSYTCLLNCPPNPCGWVVNIGSGVYVSTGVAQAVLLAGIFGGAFLATRLLSQSESHSTGTRSLRPHRYAVLWFFGMAVVALVDLALFVASWVRWANCRVEHYGEAFAFPMKEVAVGSVVALSIAGASVALGLFLLRRKRLISPAHQAR